MTRVLIQPASNPAAHRHYRDTIERPVLLSPRPELPDALRDQLLDRYPSGAARMWGAIGRHASPFGSVTSGDVALFTRKNHVVSAGVVGVKFRSAALADTLWGPDKDGRLWELMYTVDALAPLDVPYTEFNALIDDSLANVHMAFRLLDRDKSVRAIAGLRLDELVTEVTVDPAPGRTVGTVVDPENSTGATTSYVLPAREVAIARREAVLVRTYRQTLEAAGHECRAVFIPVYGGFTDLCDMTDAVLIEAKGSVERHRIREAIGQLFDYVRYLPFRPARLAVLLPEPPAPDLLVLMASLGVDCIIQQDSGFSTKPSIVASPSWQVLLP